MVVALKRLDASLQDIMRGFRLEVGNEADTACISLTLIQCFWRLAKSLIFSDLLESRV